MSAWGTGLLESPTVAHEARRGPVRIPVRAGADPFHETAELRQLRHRVALYESVDQSVSQAVAHSHELMRAIAVERERAAAAFLTRAEVDARITGEAAVVASADRERFQQTLMELMDDVDRVQSHLDGLVQHIAEAITQSTTRAANGR